MTERLYLHDSWLRQFDATVVGLGQWQGRASVLLDRSAFYPESGGQMADRGELAAARVVDVQVDDTGQLHHIVEGAQPAIFDKVRGAVEAERRRLHMAQHTGQHLLSRALLNVAKADTISSRLGETACTLDTSLSTLSEAQLAEAAALANQIIDDDVLVQALYPDAAELQELALRRPSKVEEDIRVVKIGDFDLTPCGGTHCTRSAQVGLIAIHQLERYKGGFRITFAAGARARQRLTRDHELLAALCRRLSCGAAELDGAVAKLERQASASRRELGIVRGRLAEALAAGLLDGGPQELLVLAFDDQDAQLVRDLATVLCRAPGQAVALAACGPDATQVVIARSADRELDCGQLLRAVASACGGRGGGRPQRAEGRLPAGVDWPSLVAAARQ